MSYNVLFLRVIACTTIYITLWHNSKQTHYTFTIPTRQPSPSSRSSHLLSLEQAPAYVVLNCWPLPRDLRLCHISPRTCGGASQDRIVLLHLPLPLPLPLLDPSTLVFKLPLPLMNIISDASQVYILII